MEETGYQQKQSVVHKINSPKVEIGFVQTYRGFLQLYQMNIYRDSLFQNNRWSKTITHNRNSTNHAALDELIHPMKKFMFQCAKYQG